MRKPYITDRLRSDIDQNFTPIPNALLEDDISPASKLVWSYMFSKPSTWNFSITRIGEALGMSKNTVNKVIRELIDNDWLIQYTEKRRSWYVFLVPVECTSDYEKPSPIAHTYGTAFDTGEIEKGNTVPHMSLTNAIERVKLAYCVYDLDEEYLCDLASTVYNCSSWVEFDAKVHEEFKSKYNEDCIF